MRNLFGQGIHPDADRIQADVIDAGGSAPAARSPRRSWARRTGWWRATRRGGKG